MNSDLSYQAYDPAFFWPKYQISIYFRGKEEFDMNYQETAAKILPNIGGRENIINLEHCSTRLRFTVADKGKVDVEALKGVPGVLQVIINSQVQVVIGNDVIEVYDELMKTGGFDQAKTAAVEAPAEKKNPACDQSLSQVY